MSTANSSSGDSSCGQNGERRLLYCHCAYSNVIPSQVKTSVLRQLCDKQVAFDAVSDLCEMSARKDPSLARLVADEGEIRIAACYPRAVRWLFANAGVELPKERVEVLNMRKLDADAVLDGLLGEDARIDDTEANSRDEGQ